MNYTKLIAQNPFKYGSELVNQSGQKIEFYEHPEHGDSAEIIAVCHELKVAAYSGFHDLDDMLADHKEYEPNFIDGKIVMGWELQYLVKVN